MIILRKSYLTLIEIIVVIALIGMLTGVLAYNYAGSLEEGKSFKTKAGIEKLTTILSLAVAEDPSIEEHIEGSWQAVVRKSPLVKNPDDLIRDGWGDVYDVSIGENNSINVTSRKYNEYKRTHKGK